MHSRRPLLVVGERTDRLRAALADLFENPILATEDPLEATTLARDGQPVVVFVGAVANPGTLVSALRAHDSELSVVLVADAPAEVRSLASVFVPGPLDRAHLERIVAVAEAIAGARLVPSQEHLEKTPPLRRRR